MNILVLGPTSSPLSAIISENGGSVIECAEPVDLDFLKSNDIEIAVSYRYRHMIKRPVIRFLRGQIINLHISLLPWNRGADPNLWSFLEDTPKGITIHHVDEGIDTGDIIAQKEIRFDLGSETLATSYRKLNGSIIDLFREIWPKLLSGKCRCRSQLATGSIHYIKDKKRFEYLLREKGWDTPVHELIGKALDHSAGRQSAVPPLR